MPGVERAVVSFPERRADVEARGVEPAVHAVEEAGYRASVVEPPRSRAAPPNALHTYPRAASQTSSCSAAARRGSPRRFVRRPSGARHADRRRRARWHLRQRRVRALEDTGARRRRPASRSAASFESVRTVAQSPDFQKGHLARRRARDGAAPGKNTGTCSPRTQTSPCYRAGGLINRDPSISIDGDVLKSGRLIVTTGASSWAPPIPAMPKPAS
jgi:hypothetical protein